MDFLLIAKCSRISCFERILIDQPGPADRKALYRLNRGGVASGQIPYEVHMGQGSDGEFARVLNEKAVNGLLSDAVLSGGMMTTRLSTPQDAARIMEIWRGSVDATHDFLTPEDRLAIEAEVAGFLPGAPLVLALDMAGRPIGFMLVHEGHMEALFIDPAYRGQGVGRLLVSEALMTRPNLTTDVNEQNAQAVGFYERMGFRRTGRSARDGQGRPYPLVHLEAAAPSP